MLYVAIGFVWLVAGAMSWQTVRMWRDPRYTVHFVSRFRFKPDFNRGLSRGCTASALGMVSLALFIPLAAYSDPERGVMHGPTWLRYLEMGLLLLFLVGLGLQFCIAWFNRPRFLVPPHRRDELGVWWERRVTSP